MGAHQRTRWVLHKFQASVFHTQTKVPRLRNGSGTHVTSTRPNQRARDSLAGSKDSRSLKMDIYLDPFSSLRAVCRVSWLRITDVSRTISITIIRTMMWVNGCRKSYLQHFLEVRSNVLIKRYHLPTLTGYDMACIWSP